MMVRYVHTATEDGELVLRMEKEVPEEEFRRTLAGALRRGFREAGCNVRCTAMAQRIAEEGRRS